MKIQRSHLSEGDITELGHHGRTGTALDVGTTLAGSSDEHLGPTTGMCVRPLKALGYVSLGKATPLHFHESFTFRLNSVSQFGISIVLLRRSPIFRNTDLQVTSSSTFPFRTVQECLPAPGSTVTLTTTFRTTTSLYSWRTLVPTDRMLMLSSHPSSKIHTHRKPLRSGV